MKKIFTLCAAAALAVSATAQTVTESKTFDNWYIGINGGVATGIHPSQLGSENHSWAKDITPNAGIRVGRYFTPVFGLAAESNVYFSDLHHAGRTGNNLFANRTKTVVNSINTSLIATVNFSNWFCGYKGQPRTFELSAVYGLGWGHVFGGKDGERYYANAYGWNATDKKDFLTSKAGLDFAFNLGSAKAWQLYVEPAVIWNLEGGQSGVRYNANYADFQVNVGLVYKFKNSNGTHNFTIAQLRDQAEIDGLNAKINDLRNDLNGKDSEIAAKNAKINDLQKALDECNNTPKYVKPETATNLQPTVIFRQGKSVVDKSQYANVELIAQYMKNHPEANIEIKGYASPEGSKELNQKLSENRAEAVKKILVNKYKISADRLTTKGMGATDKLFEQVEFNRVATFNDSTK
jgi:OmpA-OmpF porin, OOP family